MRQKMFLSLSTLLLFVSNAFGADPAPSPFAMRFGLGLTEIVNDHLTQSLQDVGQTAVDPNTLIPYEWAYSLFANGLRVDVASARTTNTVLTALTGTNRTRLVVDATELTFGTQLNLPAGVNISAGLGVGLTKMLLQTYVSSQTTLAGVLGSTGQVSLVSSWNWSPVASLHLSWRFWTAPNTNVGYALGVGVTATGFFLPFQWKLNDDVPITGLGAPWDYSLRPVLTLEIG